MSLTDVQHQSQAHRLIQRAIARERVPHAYIFHGPDGVGKELLARGLAQLLLCEHPIERRVDGANEGKRAAEHGGPRSMRTAARPPFAAEYGKPMPMRTGCGTCEECRLVAAGTHPDWHLIYRQLNRDHPDPAVRRRKGLEIGVDVLRHFVIEKVGHTPLRGRAKVFVIREADRITTQAQNALLKTLEEPPGTTFIILLVSSLDRLLPTTLSRCQLIGFDALPTAFVGRRLTEQRSDLTADRIDWYAAVAQGSIGAALEAAGDELYEVNERLLATLAPSKDTPGRSAPRASDRASASGAATIKLWTEIAGELGNRYRKRDPDISNTEATRRGLKALLNLAAVWYADVLRVQTGGATDAPKVKDDGADGEIAGGLDEPGHSSEPADTFDESMGLFAALKDGAPPPPPPSKADAVSTRKRVPKPVIQAEDADSGSARLVNRAWKSVLEQLAGVISPDAAVEAVGRIARAEQQLDQNANTQLVIEVLLNDLAQVNAGESVILA